MKTALTYLWRGWMVALGTVLTLSLCVPVLLLSIHEKHYRSAYFFIRLWCLGMFYGMGFRYKLINPLGKKLDRARQYILIANHTSLMDVMLPCILAPHHPLCYVGKKELEKIPVFGMVYRRICVLVDRQSGKSRADVYRKCAERMRAGQSIVLFPEGGVPDDTSVILDHFKDGAFTLAAIHQLPIAVYTFCGLKKMFPFKNSEGYPGTMKVVFNDVLEPGTESRLLKEIAYNTIKKTLLDLKC